MYNKTSTAVAQRQISNILCEEVDREVLQTALAHERYDGAFAASMIDRARGEAGASWQGRMLAILILEHQILLLDEADLDGHYDLLEKLGLKNPGAAEVQGRLACEGYPDLKPAAFVGAFRRRLNRLASYHRDLREDPGTVGAFLQLLATPSLLTCARYLVSPEDVYAHICDHLRLTRGLPDNNPVEHRFFHGERDVTLNGLPAYEADLLRLLWADSQIYWVCPETSSELGGVVEFPLTTVVAVLKPPGSDLEFEIKRVGVRGDNPLGAVFKRDGKEVPISHRIHGGSMAHLLRWEAGGCAFFARAFRAIHGSEAPICKVLSLTTIYDVPVGREEPQLLRYFTDERYWGTDYEAMRAEMGRCIRAFAKERKAEVPAFGGLSDTAAFITYAPPGQAVLINSSMFRLDKLVTYLGAEGPATYFEGLGRDWSPEDGRRFADLLLFEILGDYQRTGLVYEDQAQYVGAALAAQRKLADETFTEMVGTLGTFWGTLLALRIATLGESVVARNVGLKAVFRDGRWRSVIIFQDHDDMQIVGKRHTNFQPNSTMNNTWLDEKHLFGGKLGYGNPVGDVAHLARIYQVDEDTLEAAYQHCRARLRAAYVAGLNAFDDPGGVVASMFEPEFVKRLRDWDYAVVTFLDVRDSEEGVARWEDELTAYLEARKYSKKLVSQYTRVIKTYGDWLFKYGDLYRAGNRG